MRSGMPFLSDSDTLICTSAFGALLAWIGSISRLAAYLAHSTVRARSKAPGDT